MPLENKKLTVSLDNRLQLCADFVRDGSRIADIGTDHACLPVWLCSCGKCTSAVAADINREPLKRGQENIENAGMAHCVTTRLSDGLKNIRSDEADDIVIAGMGGELIAKIISDCSFSKDKSKRFILQPMTKSEVLIKWLTDNGYEIERQDCCIASNRCYTVLLAKYTGEIRQTDELFNYLAKLSPKTNETHRLFVQNHICRLLKKANGDAHFAMLADRLREYLNDKDY